MARSRRKKTAFAHVLNHSENVAEAPADAATFSSRLSGGVPPSGSGPKSTSPETPFPVNLTQTAANFRMRVIGPERQQWEKLLYSARFLRSQGRGASPFQRALPESKHASRGAGFTRLALLRDNQRRGGRGGGGYSFDVGQTCPRLMSSVFRYRFFPPTKGFAAACFIHEATWCSSRSSTDASSTPRVDLPIPIGVTGGSGLISVPRMNISFT